MVLDLVVQAVGRKAATIQSMWGRVEKEMNKGRERGVESTLLIVEVIDY